MDRCIEESSRMLTRCRGQYKPLSNLSLFGFSHGIAVSCAKISTILADTHSTESDRMDNKFV